MIDLMAMKEHLVALMTKTRTKALTDAQWMAVLSYFGTFLSVGETKLAAAEARVAELTVALRAYDHWAYESGSARATGESLYSARDFAEMRDKAMSLGTAALAKQASP